jgi:hypothetical protein
VTVALLAATAAAFLVTERLKLERSPVQGTRVTAAFSPVCDCATNEATVRFGLRRAEDVSIAVTRDGHVVRELLVASRLRRGVHTFTWNGRDAGGALAPDGSYDVRLDLHGNRTIVLPQAIVLDTVAPVVVSTKATPTVFSPDRDGRSDRVIVTYRFDEPGHARLYVGSRLVVRGHSKTSTGALAWYGRGGGVRARPGRYRLLVAAVDLAGNISQQKDVGVVTLRYVALPHRVYRTRPLRRFTVHVSTDARTLTYRLAGRSFTGGRVVRLRAPRSRGRYRLVVTDGRHRARAIVVVRR